MMDPGQESTQPASHYWQSRLDNQSDCVAQSSDLASDNTTRQLSDCDLKFPEEDSSKLQASSSSSSGLFSFYDSSLQSPERRHFHERNSPRKALYDEHSSSPDNCQTSQVRNISDHISTYDRNISIQVSSSVSVAETVLYTRDRQSGKADTQDSNWDINDPDIPARIEQYVRILYFYISPPSPEH